MRRRKRKRRITQIIMRKSKKRHIITCRVQNPDTHRAGRVGAAHSGRWGGGKLGKPSCRHFGRPRRKTSLFPSRVP